MADGIEWVKIAEYANDHGYNAASRRFPSIKNGKENTFHPKILNKK